MYDSIPQINEITAIGLVQNHEGTRAFAKFGLNRFRITWKFEIS